MGLMINQFIEHQSFLELCREHPESMDASDQIIMDDLYISLLDTGVLIIEPKNAGSTDVIISSGIHGNETAPIEICDLLVREILEGSLSVQNRIMFIIGNPHAMNNGERFIEENLNRLFCGKHSGKSHTEAKRAANLERYVDTFFNSPKGAQERCHFDLHTAIRASKYEKFAIYPYQDGREWNKSYLNFFKDSGLNTILFAHHPAGTFSYFSSHNYQSNSFTVELGKVRAFGENDMSSFSQMTNNLRLLISDQYQYSNAFDNNDFNLYQVVDEVIRHSEKNFSLNIDADLANFSQFPIGFKLTTDDNDSYIISSEQHGIVFPNANIPVGQRVALIVEKTTI